MQDFRTIFDLCDKAGKASAIQCVPRGMIVSGGGLSEYVADGVCGFAWVNIKPGNSKFANWLKANRLARSDDYYGGVTIWISDYDQSMQKKEAYARGFVNELKKHGFERSYVGSRMD